VSKVYFLKIKDKKEDILTEAGEKIFKVFADYFIAQDRVAVKVHFGERGSSTYLNPILTEAIYNSLKSKVKKAALVDCSVLYKGERSFAAGHKKLALEHGFGFAPIVIADGERGDEEIKVRIDQKHFKEVKIGAAMKDFNAVLCLSHFTGHGLTGFGACLKNIGMGLGSKAGKLAMHHKTFNLEIDADLCRGCEICKNECPANAISIKQGKAHIDQQKCIGCGKCLCVCPVQAVSMPFGNTSSKELQERIVEYALGALQGKKSLFFNVLLDITPQCDCMRNVKQKAIVPDIGILVSQDIVAIEQAGMDLIGEKHFHASGIDPNRQIDYAEQIGLGEKKYELVEIN